MEVGGLQIKLYVDEPSDASNFWIVYDVDKNELKAREKTDEGHFQGHEDAFPYAFCQSKMGEYGFQQFIQFLSDVFFIEWGSWNEWTSCPVTKCKFQIRSREKECPIDGLCQGPKPLDFGYCLFNLVNCGRITGIQE